MTPSVPFIHLVKELFRGADNRQDAIVCLLESKPETEADARSCLSRLHHRKEFKTRSSRKLTHGTVMQLNFDPSAKADPKDGQAMKALDLLSAEDQQIITQHVINGLTFREIGSLIGMSQVGVMKRFRKAANNLREMRDVVNKTY